ncbi:hypothetical protein HT746_20115 [Burkholderia pyrrocinia]|uniref:hypothetical protein n=1 Tax=Burkholderia pyrrocinia TaxID=60550 RepID=UPI001576C266|nr:hypothetical protein [Burkholderia pyrrocinia]NTX29399.1 hypothetical protein [Burkholderia pyrrocinia]
MKVATLRVLARRLALLATVPTSMNAEAASTSMTVESARPRATQVNADRWPPNLSESDKRIHLSGAVIASGRNTSGEAPPSDNAPASSDLLIPLAAGKSKDDGPPKKLRPDNRFQVICTLNGGRALCRYASTASQNTVENGHIAVVAPLQRTIDRWHTRQR